MIRRVPIFKIKIVYKSGHTHEFEVYDFTIKGGRYEWTSVSESNKPMMLGVDQVAAIYGRRVFVRFGSSRGNRKPYGNASQISTDFHINPD